MNAAAPMPGILEECAAAMGALRRICFGKRDAGGGLDASRRGFVSSFFAFTLLLPVHFLLCAIQWRVMQEPDFQAFFAPGGIVEGGSFGLFFWTRLGLALLNFLMFPLVMLPISALINRRERFFPFVVGWNWAAVPTTLLFLLLFLLFPMMPMAPILVFPIFACWFLAVWILWRVIRALLDVERLAAFGLLLLYGTLSIFLDVLYSLPLT